MSRENSNRKVEGYWCAPHIKDKYPDPRDRVNPDWPYRREFVEKLKAIEAPLMASYKALIERVNKRLDATMEMTAEQRKATYAARELENEKELEELIASPVQAYHGSSKCRFCNVLNGSAEYDFKHWVWPTGYLHYITDHDVVPSPEFLEFVMHTEIPQ